MDKSYKPFINLPQVSTTGDTSTYIIASDDGDTHEFKFVDNELKSVVDFSQLPDSVRQSANELSLLLSEQSENGTEIEAEDSETVRPFDPETIRIERRTVSMDTILRRIEQGSIIMNPGFQRNEVWDDDRKCQLIESFLLKIPIPMFYIAADKDDNWTVVDGLQRLTAIRDFMLGEKYLQDKVNNIQDKEKGLRLSGLEFCGDELNGLNLTYSNACSKSLGMYKCSILDNRNTFYTLYICTFGK